MKKKGYIILGIVFFIIIMLVITLIILYNSGTKEPIQKDSEPIESIINIENGTSTIEILDILKQNNAIKSELVAKIYIALNDINNLQAGKYLFTGKETLQQVLETISSGKVMDETVTITFKEGKNMRDIAAIIAEKTNNTTNDVYNLLEDEEYITSIIDKYWFITDDIKNKNIYYPLEGYLYPNTYKFENKDVDVKTIFEKMLEGTNKLLTANKERIESSRFSVHEILTVASVVELEGNDEENRSRIASVIYNRLQSNMALGSDVTTYYAIKVDMGERDLYSKEINTYNPYNTRGPDMEGKLPVGPIANFSQESLEATINPAREKYLYFVADKNGDIYFTKTYEEHQEMIANLRKKGLWYEYK